MVAHWYLAENYIESDKLKDSPRIEYEKVRDSFNSCKNEEDFARMKVLVVEALLEKFSYTNESIEKYHIEEMEKLGRKAQLIEKKIQIYEELMIKCKDEIKHCSGFEEHGVLPKAIRKTLDKCLVKAKIVEQDHIALNKAKAKVKEEMVEREEKFKKFMKVGVTERTSHAQGMTQEQLKIELVNLVNLEVLKIQAKKAKKRDWFLECFEMSL
uniref:Uncharacterized protein n=1 Tax=Rhabditophanes sp. KR3021 TaxID=114890 RepID=A0AC35TVF0_9BILA